MSTRKDKSDGLHRAEPRRPGESRLPSRLLWRGPHQPPAATTARGAGCGRRGRDTPGHARRGVRLVVANWHASGDFSRQTQDRLGEIVAHAVARARHLGVTHFDDTFDEQVCAKFIRSPVSSTLTTPSASTMHLRRSALRPCFHTLRRMDHFRGDPTLDIVLPPRSQLAARMATDPPWKLWTLFRLETEETWQRPRSARRPGPVQPARPSAGIRPR